MKVNFIKNTQLADDLIILEAQQKNDIIDSIIGDIESTISAIECFIDGQKLTQLFYHVPVSFRQIKKSLVTQQIMNSL